MGVQRKIVRLARILVALLMIAGLCVAEPRATVLAAALPGIYAYDFEEMTIGEVDFVGVAFYNTSSTNTGYGPFIDVFLPATGADGAGAEIDDGVTFSNADLYQIGAITPLAPTPLICTGGSFTHPLTRLATPCIDGDQVLVFELPFGSFAPDQPFQFLFLYLLMSSWADPGTPLEMRLRGGFWLGNDPLDNPASDPPIIMGAGPYEIVPRPPLTLNKLSFSPEQVQPGPRFGETSTGFNFPQRFYLTADIPEGQTIRNLQLRELLPATMVYSEVTGIEPSTCSLIREPPRSGPQLPPNNEIIIGCPNITGRAGPDDVNFTFAYWVPRLDANGDPVLDPATGALRVLGNNAAVSGEWQPLDPRDNLFPIEINPSGFEDTLRAQSISIQKVEPTLVNDPQGNGLSPGDTLEYTLTFQISDYFAFDTIIISDTLSDGQRYRPASARLTLSERNDTVSGAFQDGVSLTIDTSQIDNTGPGGDDTDGSTTLRFDVGQAMRDLGAPDGIVQGAEAPLPAGQIAEGIVTFRAVIQERFSDSYPSGDPSVDLWDTLNNQVTISGRVLNHQTLTPTGSFAADTPAEDDNKASFSLPGPEFAKSVYAINGVVCDPQPCADPVIEPADIVTYRLTYSMPFVDVEDARLADFLPSPIFTATELQVAAPILPAGLPPPGRVAYGPDDNFHSLPGAPRPAISIDPFNNAVFFNYADYDRNGSPAGTIDLLFTVTASDQPFDNRLFITNQAQASEGSTNTGRHSREDSVEIGLAPLVLRLRKGIVATNSPSGRFVPPVVGPVAFAPPGSPDCPRFTGAISSNSLAARPIDSNLRNLLPGERLTFAVVLENYGPSAGGAFDVTLRDDLPADLILSRDSICVTDGAGEPLAFSDLPGGLFGEGIRLDDPGATAAPAGALDPYSPVNGRNLAIITYDVTVRSSLTPPRTLTNTTTLFRYAEAEGGDDNGRDKTDSADVTVLDPTAITLLRFSARHENGQVVVRWVTGAELNTRGFALLRSDDGSRDGATLVTPRPLPPRGLDGGGTSYSWPDPTARPDRHYAYWLVEIEQSGATNEYGPTRTVDISRGDFWVALPLIQQ